MVLAIYGSTSKFKTRLKVESRHKFSAVHISTMTLCYCAKFCIQKRNSVKLSDGILACNTRSLRIGKHKFNLLQTTGQNQKYIAKQGANVSYPWHSSKYSVYLFNPHFSFPFQFFSSTTLIYISKFKSLLSHLELAYAGIVIRM